MKAEPEKVLYTIALYTGSGIEDPDYLSTVDVDPNSRTYSQVIHRTPMPHVGDELHHFGWNACSSCHDDEICFRHRGMNCRHSSQNGAVRRLREALAYDEFPGSRFRNSDQHPPWLNNRAPQYLIQYTMRLCKAPFRARPSSPLQARRSLDHRKSDPRDASHAHLPYCESL